MEDVIEFSMLVEQQQVAQQHFMHSRPPIVSSPTSTLANEEADVLHDAAALAASFRTRMAALATAASPAPSAASQQARGMPHSTPGTRLLTFFNNSPHPTPTQHATDQHTVQVLEKKWKNLYGGMRSNSQAAADVLMRQAQTTSQLEEVMQVLFIQLKGAVEDRARLQQQVLQERAAMMAQAEGMASLGQRLQTWEHRGATVQVVTESLQAQLLQMRDALEVSNRERQQLADQVKHLSEQLSVTAECRSRGDALISEQAAVIDTLRQQLHDHSSATSALADDKAALEAQLQGVLAAEQELTVHLRETHTAIEGQLGMLRDQLKTERQKRATVVKRRGELQAQVEHLQAQIAAQQSDMAALADRMTRGGGGQAHHSTQPAAAARSGHTTPPPSTLRAAGSSRAHVGPATAAPGSVHAGHAPPSTASASPSPAAGTPGGVAGVGHPRSRAPLRPVPSTVANSAAAARASAQSPTASSSASGGAAAVARTAIRRGTSPTPKPPTAAEGEGHLDVSNEWITTGQSVRGTAAVAVHIPLSLPHAGSSLLPSPGNALEHELSVASGMGGGTPATAAMKAERRRSGGGAEPLSPPIHLMPVSPHAQRHTTAGGHNGNSRRRSLSPEPSRASMNAMQHARRAGPVATGRAASPAPGATSSTWLP